jgi:hypothetical protein
MTEKGSISPHERACRQGSQTGAASDRALPAQVETEHD